MKGTLSIHNMFGIGHLFQNIRGKFAKEVLARQVIAECVKRHVGIDVPVGKISFNSGTAVLTGLSQAARSAIFIKKEAILRDIAKEQSVRVVSDLR